jgi:glycosyltransferase involved in cell wall biosynthesis
MLSLSCLESIALPARRPNAVPALWKPTHLIYSISAGIGGSGLDVDALEALRLAHEDGFLERAVAHRSRQDEIPPRRLHLLRHDPVRLLGSFLGRPEYYALKKKRLDAVTARLLERGPCDLFHSWSGDCLESLKVCNRRGIATVLEIPTWHRNKGKPKPYITRDELMKAEAPFPRGFLHRLRVSRQRVLEEYDRADLILVLSEKARETFLVAGIAPEKLYLLPRGVDVEAFRPAPPPPVFRVGFAGSLIRRKGVHHLLRAWKRLNLPNAELLLIGHRHPEIESALRECALPNVRLTGFVRDVGRLLSTCTIHAFPSECEGSAKVTYEAAACGLAQISTREAGDVVVHGETGLVIPPNDPDALAGALEHLYHHPALAARMGARARERVEREFTWAHYRDRLRLAYSRALGIAAGGSL